MKNPLKSAINEAQRDREIIRIFTKYGFGAFLRKMNSENFFRRTLMKKDSIEKYTNLTRGKRLRMAFEELGPTFVKLGQLLSTREDIIPGDIVAELKSLQDDVRPYSHKEAKRIFKEETGLELLEEFDKFDLEPLAAASIGQVYRAKLKTGENVVVKIQRPDIEETVEMDLKIMARLSKLVDKTLNKNGVMSFEKIITEFSSYLNKELNYVNEAQNASTFYNNFKDDANIVIPKIYWKLTTKRVLVMDEILGIRLSDMEKIDKLGYDKQRIAMLISESFMKQVLLDGVFHGDPHAGNIMIVDKDQIAFIDFGIVGYLDNSTKRFITVIVKSIKSKNTDRIAEALIDINRDVEDVDEESLKKDIYSIMNTYVDTPFDKVDLTKMLSDLINVSQSYKLTIPPQLTMMVKSIVIIQGTINTLNPEFSVSDMVTGFVKHLYKSNINIKDFARDMLDFMGDEVLNTKTLLRQFHKIVNTLARNRVHLRIEQDFSEKSKKTIESTGRTIAFAMVLSAMIIASTLLLINEHVHSTIPIRVIIILNLLADITLANIFLIRAFFKRK